MSRSDKKKWNTRMSQMGSCQEEREVYLKAWFARKNARNKRKAKRKLV